MPPKPSAMKPIRAAVYARYSSDEQRPESITDQLESCRRHCEAKGWTVTGTYTDAAMSGASDHRPEFKRLRDDAEAGMFDMVVAESLDRLSRRLADVAGFHDRLAFRRIGLHTVDRGEISPLLAGVLGAIGQSYLDDLRHKTRRGLRGKALAGLSAGGVTYGYDVAVTDNGEPGARTINEEEAAVVRRIFAEAAAGRSPRDIAKALNADGITPPRHTRTKGQREWGDTTIRGQTKRGTGILNNELYVGRLVWDRCSYVKDPATGKRVARPKPPEEWERTDVPHLRIIGDDLWDAVKARQAAVTKDMSKAEGDSRGHALARANRPKHMLSGLLVCGSCGSPYILVGKDYYGCNRHRSKGTCGNGLKVRLGDMEGRVVDALRHWLLQPSVLAEGVATMRERVARTNAEAGKESAALRRRLASLEGQVSNIVDAIATGTRSPALLAKLAALESDMETVKAEMAAGALPPPEIPDAEVLAEGYRLIVDNLLSLADGPEMAALVRRIVTKVVLTPTPDGDGLKAEMAGSLTRAVELFQALESKQPSNYSEGCSTAVVAGRRFEPLTFRL